MQLLKGLALGLVGFFLFLGLPLLGLTYTLNNTLLNSQFITSEVSKLNISQAIREAVSSELSSSDQTYLPAVDKTLADIKPWLDEQIHIVIDGVYAYLLGKTGEININIPLDPVEPDLVNNLTAIYLQNPPAGYQQLPDSEKKRLLAEAQQQYRDLIPSTLAIDSTTIGSEGMRTLQQVKEIFSYIRTAYIWLIVAVLVLIGLIILIQREIRGSTLTLGIIFLITGILSGVGYLIARQLIPGIIQPGNIPASVHVWITQTIQNGLTPWLTFSLAFLGAGIILLVFFVLIKRSPKPTG